tara:strand:+ start:1543 stop:2367 length:825 start_codon:yes stop_codon:yes gene_type:complete
MSDINLKIKNILCEYDIIKSQRIKNCGRWFNKQIAKNGPILPVKYLCMKWQCRVCRNKLIEDMQTKHFLKNSEFLKNSGRLLHIKLKTNKFKNTDEMLFFANFKKTIAQLKDTRGWEKIKLITNGVYHYDTSEVRFTDKEYQIWYEIFYAIKNIKTDIFLTKDLIHEYLNKISKKSRLNVFTGNEPQVKYFIEKEIINKFNQNRNKAIDLRTSVKGTLENLESEFYLTAISPTTSLRSFEFLKNKKLNEIGKVIIAINYMKRKSRQGRIWNMDN